MRLIGIICCICFFCTHLWGQSVEHLPDDPRVVKSSIANGFTYYLIENDLRQGYADFYLIRKVGSVNESAGERGFNNIISEMGAKGTRNFPNNTVARYFDELGLDQASDFSIVNGVEESYYRVENIPVGRGGSVVDSTLLILYNWAAGINLDEEEVEVGKTLYKNSLARRLNGNNRGALFHAASVVNPILEGERDTIDIDSYKAKDLRSFYYRWFIPERMALVVVGDIDKGVLDAKIKSLFQALPQILEKPEERGVEFLPHKEPIISISPQSDVCRGDFSIYFTTPPLPENLRGSAVPYVEEYMISMMTQLLMERLVYASQSSDLPYFCREVTFGRFMESSGQNGLRIDLVTTTDGVSGVYEEVMALIDNIKSNGFTEEEFRRAKMWYFNELDYYYDWRLFTPNRLYAERAIGNFLNKTSLASIEMRKEYMDLASDHIGLSQFNMFVSSHFRNGDNCVVTYTHPDNGRVGSVSFKVADKIGPKVFDNGRKPYIYPPVRKPGSIVGEYPDVATGAKVWNLSNGATVIFKQTQAEPNKFRFEAISKGGLSLMDPKSGGWNYINDISAVSSAGHLSLSDMILFKRNEKIVLDRSFDLNTSRLAGGGYSANVDSFFKMVYLHFTPTKVDSTVFEKYNAIKSEILLSKDFSPEEVFRDSVSTLIYNPSNYISTPTIENFGAVNYISALSFINERFSNAANFTFVIVGDLDETKLKDMVLTYIASLPGNPMQSENWKYVPIYLRKSDRRVEWEMEMDYVRNFYNMTLVSPSSYSARKFAEINLASEVIVKRVSTEMKERGYPIEIKREWIKYPEEFLTHSFSGVTKEFTQDWEASLLEVLNDLKANGATEQELSNAKSVLVESFRRGERETLDFWESHLAHKVVYGSDMYSKYLEYVQDGSLEVVNNTLKGYLQGSINTILILKGVN